MDGQTHGPDTSNRGPIPPSAIQKSSVHVTALRHFRSLNKNEAKHFASIQRAKSNRKATPYEHYISFQTGRVCIRGSRSEGTRGCIPLFLVPLAIMMSLLCLCFRAHHGILYTAKLWHFCASDKNESEYLPRAFGAQNGNIT